MSIGVRCHDYGCASAQEMARRVSVAGFEAIQLAMSKCLEGGPSEYGHLSPGYCRNIKNAFEKKGIEIAVVGCYIDPATLNEEKRQKDVERYLEHIAYCRQLGSYIVGTETSGCDDAHRPEQYKQLMKSLEKMAEQAEHFGVFAGIEPVFVHTLNTPKLAKQMLKDIACKNVQIILDPINLLHPTNIEKQREIIDDAFECFGDRIVAIHAKDITWDDNGGFKRCVIGEGMFDSQYFFDKVKQAKPGITVLREEAHPETAHKDIAALKNYLGL